MTPVPNTITRGRRMPDRVIPIGVKDAPATLIVVCSDGVILELDRAKYGVNADWVALPPIPQPGDELVIVGGLPEP